MTERLFDTDSFIREFTATVLEIKSTENGFIAVLDRTAFFPEGGGQKSDTGYLDSVPVTDVQEENGVIYHYISKAVPQGKAVTGRINWEERFFKMQNHTAEHIISGIVHTEYGYDNTGFHLSENSITMDYNGTLTQDDVDRIELLANKAVWENRPVYCYYPKNTSSISYRSKLDIKENLRIVEIEGIDTCACCAPHVKYTGEIGLIKIVSFMKFKGGIRMFLKAGSVAYNEVCSYFRTLKKTSNLLSLPMEETASGVERLLHTLEDIRYENNGLKAVLLKNEAENSEYPFLFTDSPELLKDAVNLLNKKFPSLCGAFSGNDESGYRFMILTDNIEETRSVLKERLSASCGGRDNMLQGLVKCDRISIENLFLSK